jgi:hypothetical protein
LYWDRWSNSVHAYSECIEKSYSGVWPVTTWNSDSDHVSMTRIWVQGSLREDHPRMAMETQHFHFLTMSWSSLSVLAKNIKIERVDCRLLEIWVNIDGDILSLNRRNGNFRVLPWY